MTDRNRDPHPDSPPSDNHDRRSDLEQAVDSRNDDVERAEDADPASPLEPAVSPDTAGGAGGAVRNQDESAQ